VLSICSPPFGTDGQASRAAAGEVKQGVETHYGTAGPGFVSRLQSKLAEDGGSGKLSARHAELTEMLRGGTDMTGRRAPLIACLALTAELAAELAASWGIVPFQPPSIADWSSTFAADPQRDNRPEMALDLVRGYLAAHADKMWGSNDGSHPPASGWIGHESGEGPALLPEKLREELRRRGYELDAVIPGWLEMGALLTLDSQRPAHLIPRRTAGRLSRHLVFRDEILDPPADPRANEPVPWSSPLPARPVPPRPTLPDNRGYPGTPRGFRGEGPGGRARDGPAAAGPGDAEIPAALHTSTNQVDRSAGEFERDKLGEAAPVRPICPALRALETNRAPAAAGPSINRFG
jgi:hypothetical protein